MDFFNRDDLFKNFRDRRHALRRSDLRDIDDRACRVILEPRE